MLLSILAASLLAVPTPAPMPGEAESAKFKVFFEKGEALYQAGEYGPAIYNFEQADAQRVTPEVAYDLAKSHEKLGDSAFTLLYYRLYMRRAPEATDTLQVAEKVGQALAKAEGEGRGFLELWAPRAGRVTVKGQRFAAPPVAMFLPAGDYEIEAEFPSGTKKMVVQIRTGRTTSVTFEPVQPPLLPIERALDAELVAAGIEQDNAPSASSTRIASYIVAGVGVAALITGIVLGVSANADAAQAANKANTVSVAQAAAASANGKGVAANVLFGAGGASVVGGVVLFIFSMPEPGMKASGGSQ